MSESLLSSNARLQAGSLVAPANAAAAAPARAWRRLPGRPRRGDLVMVRPLEEIRATLDENGMLDGLPFMPEMAAWCGRAVKVHKRAERVCVEGTWVKRDMRRAVFLEGARCDGSAHDGCGRGCLFFWKEAWLSAAPRARSAEADRVASDAPRTTPGVAAQPGRGEPAVYSCQSTHLMSATKPFGRWSLRPYLTDLLSGNIDIAEFARLARGELGRICSRLLGRDRAPWSSGATKTPVAALGLRPGDLVEVRSRKEILDTLDEQGRNRGLAFEEAMLDHCNRQYRVLRRVDRIVLETSGAMREIRDTVVLEGVNCNRCARANQLYWREIWLKRAGQAEAGGSEGGGGR